MNCKTENQDKHENYKSRSSNRARIVWLYTGIIWNKLWTIIHSKLPNSMNVNVWRLLLSFSKLSYPPLLPFFFPPYLIQHKLESMQIDTGRDLYKFGLDYSYLTHQFFHCRLAAKLERPLARPRSAEDDCMIWVCDTAIFQLHSPAVSERNSALVIN